MINQINFLRKADKLFLFILANNLFQNNNCVEKKQRYKKCGVWNEFINLFKKLFLLCRSIAFILHTLVSVIYNFKKGVKNIIFNVIIIILSSFVQLSQSSKFSNLLWMFPDDIVSVSMQNINLNTWTLKFKNNIF